MGENLALLLYVGVLLGAGASLYLFSRRLRLLRKRASWPQLITGNAIVLLLLVSLGCTIGETYYRFFYDTTDAIDYSKVSQRWFQRHFHRNSDGFRDDLQYTMRIPPGKRRISFLGDSFAAGHGIKNTSDLFATKIRSNHPEWEIHLLANLGMDTGGALALLRQCVQVGYQFDQVVLVYCLNDVSDMLPDWNNALVATMKNRDSAGWLRRNSYFVNTMYYRYRASRSPLLSNYYDLIREAYDGALWQQQRQRLTALRDFVRANGGNLMVVTFPFLNAPAPGYPFQRAHDELHALWGELGVPHLDLLSAYSGMPAGKLTVGRYDAHPNAYAHAQAAAKIEEFLRTNMSFSGNVRPAAVR